MGLISNPLKANLLEMAEILKSIGFNGKGGFLLSRNTCFQDLSIFIINLKGAPKNILTKFLVFV